MAVLQGPRFSFQHQWLIVTLNPKVWFFRLCARLSSNFNVNADFSQFFYFSASGNFHGNQDRSL